LIAPLLDWIHFWRMEEDHTVGRLPANTKTSEQHKQQSTALHHSSEGNGGQIHNVAIGFAPSRWLLSHLNASLTANGRPKAWKNIASV
jgi:hypothetical protein